MSKRQRNISIAIFAFIIFLLVFGIALTGGASEKSETIQQVMKDEVLHEKQKIDFLFFGKVNPGLVSAVTVTVLITLFAIIVRIFAIPKFKIIPGKFQMLLEQAVGMFDNLSKTNSPSRNKFLGGYVFAAGTYIFLGTIFELFGFQAVSQNKTSVALPAPLSDINAAIALGVLSYVVILSGGIISNGLRGAGRVLKDFSLPVSMSFRLFGALLSGALVTELVYYYTKLSFVLPVIVGVLFTLLHAFIQAYVLTMLTALFYGEATEKNEKR